jgi:hypothetical protein
MLIEVTPSQSNSFFNISNNVTTLLAAVNGSELGLRGKHFTDNLCYCHHIKQIRYVGDKTIVYIGIMNPLI